MQAAGIYHACLGYKHPIGIQEIDITAYLPLLIGIQKTVNDRLLVSDHIDQIICLVGQKQICITRKDIKDTKELSPVLPVIVDVVTSTEPDTDRLVCVLPSGMICWLDWAIASGGNTSWMAIDTIATALNILFFRHEALSLIRHYSSLALVCLRVCNCILNRLFLLKSL